MRPTTLVLSPHLDDAALSLGGAIAAWVTAGERVVIATVYTAGPPLADVAPAMRVFADYAARTREDDAACAVLGAEHLRLGLIERAFRRPFLTDLAYFTTPADRADYALAPVRQALDDAARHDADDVIASSGRAGAGGMSIEDAARITRIIVPLGVGTHVDHVTTLLAGTDWALARGLAERLWFYEDFYALAGDLRRRHAVTRTKMWPSARAPLRRAPALRRVLAAIAAKQRGPDPTSLLASELRAARWSCTAVAIDEAHKLAALGCYHSQAAAFGGLAGIAAALRAYHAWWGGEPLWRAET